MSLDQNDTWEGLPGGELVRAGQQDLKQGVRSEAALLLLVAKPALEPLGIHIPAGTIEITWPPEHALYDLLAEKYGNDAHSRYNSLIRRIVSFRQALEREASRTRST